MRKATAAQETSNDNFKQYIEETIRKRTDYVGTSNTELKTTEGNEKLTNH